MTRLDKIGHAAELMRIEREQVRISKRINELTRAPDTDERGGELARAMFRLRCLDDDYRLIRASVEHAEASA